MKRLAVRCRSYSSATWNRQRNQPGFPSRHRIRAIAGGARGLRVSTAWRFLSTNCLRNRPTIDRLVSKAF